MRAAAIAGSAYPREKLNIAFLGVGDVATRDYLPELHRLRERIELVAVCAQRAMRARTVAEQYHARTWYTDAARMCADTEINAVVNPTPIQAHYETTLALLQRQARLHRKTARVHRRRCTKIA